MIGKLDIDIPCKARKVLKKCYVCIIVLSAHMLRHDVLYRCLVVVLVTPIYDIFEIYINSVTIFMFTRNEDMHNYFTRQSDKLHVPVCKLSAVYRTMKYEGVSFWNFMSTKINKNCIMNTYKHNLKTYLISNDIPIGTSH